MKQLIEKKIEVVMLTLMGVVFILLIIYLIKQWLFT